MPKKQKSHQRIELNATLELSDIIEDQNQEQEQKQFRTKRIQGLSAIETSSDDYGIIQEKMKNDSKSPTIKQLKLKKKPNYTQFDSEQSEQYYDQHKQKKQIKKSNPKLKKKIQIPKCPGTDESQDSSLLHQTKNKNISISSSPDQIFYKKVRRIEEGKSPLNTTNLTKKSIQVTERSNVGSYRYNDKPKEVLSIRKDIQKNRIEFFVSWKLRQDDDTQPYPGWINDTDLRNHDPVMLSKYLLGKIKWPK